MSTRTKVICTIGPSVFSKEKIEELGLKYNLLTEYTSFVAVDYITRRGKDSLVTVKQALPLPEGVSNYAVGGGAEMSSPLMPSMRVMNFKAASGGTASQDVAVAKSESMVDNKEIGTIRKSDLSEFLSKPIVVNRGDSTNKRDSEINAYPYFDLAEFQKLLIYPQAAKEAGIEGKVFVNVLVGKNGKAKKLEFIYSDNDLFKLEV